MAPAPADASATAPSRISRTCWPTAATWRFGARPFSSSESGAARPVRGAWRRHPRQRRRRYHRTGCQGPLMLQRPGMIAADAGFHDELPVGSLENDDRRAGGLSTVRG